MIKTIQVDGVNTAYKLLHSSCKHTVVILHGLRGDHQALLKFGKEFSDFRVIIPDLPGHGRSDKLSAHTVEEYGRWFNNFLDVLNLDNVIVIGHSMGANIAMASIKLGGKRRIKKAIYFVLYPKYHDSGINRSVKWLYRVGKKIPARHSDKVLHSRLISRLTIKPMLATKDRSVARFILDDGHRAAQRVNSRVIKDIFEDMAGMDMRKYLSDSVPQLFIITTEDKFSHNEEIKLMSSSLEKAELIELDNLGHLAPLEDPVRLRREISYWLK